MWVGVNPAASLAWSMGPEPPRASAAGVKSQAKSPLQDSAGAYYGTGVATVGLPPCPWNSQASVTALDDAANGGAATPPPPGTGSLQSGYR
jgi:hypothetical protein